MPCTSRSLSCPRSGLATSMPTARLPAQSCPSSWLSTLYSSLSPLPRHELRDSPGCPEKLAAPLGSSSTTLFSRTAAGPEQRHQSPEVDAPTDSEHLRGHQMRALRRPQSFPHSSEGRTAEIIRHHAGHLPVPGPLAGRF